MIKVLVEASVPYVRGVIERYTEAVYVHNADICRDTLKGVDAMLIRSITRCDESLLRGSSVKFIATATAGVDHIDHHYCEATGIKWTNAAGCNAMAVAQYVASSLSLIQIEHGLSLRGKTIGIIGVGYVGKLVEQVALAFGLKPLLYDPPRAEKEPEHHHLFSALERIQSESDIITLHVPLEKGGKHPTYHLVDDVFLSKCTKKPILINACRGGVVETSALIKAKNEGKISQLVIDCWEGEPRISTELMGLTEVATPHIAGFSADGKHRGARMALLAIGRHFGIKMPLELLIPTELPTPLEPIPFDTFPKEYALALTQLQTFNPKDIDNALRQAPQQFEELRRAYLFPREMGAYQVTGAKGDDQDALKRLGYKTCV